MATIKDRIMQLETKNLRGRNAVTYQVVRMDKNDSPDEHERKLRQAEEIEAAGGGVFVVRVVGGMEA